MVLGEDLKSFLQNFIKNVSNVYFRETLYLRLKKKKSHSKATEDVKLFSALYSHTFTAAFLRFITTFTQVLLTVKITNFSLFTAIFFKKFWFIEINKKVLWQNLL